MRRYLMLRLFFCFSSKLWRKENKSQIQVAFSGSRYWKFTIRLQRDRGDIEKPGFCVCVPGTRRARQYIRGFRFSFCLPFLSCSRAVDLPLVAGPFALSRTAWHMGQRTMKQDEDSDSVNAAAGCTRTFFSLHHPTLHKPEATVNVLFSFAAHPSLPPSLSFPIVHTLLISLHSPLSRFLPFFWIIFRSGFTSMAINFKLDQPRN